MRVAYQLRAMDGSWFGHFIWTERQWADDLAEAMNQDRVNMGLEPDIMVEVVEIEGEPF